MLHVESIFRNGLMEMASYSPIEPPDQIALRLGLPESEIIKLDANENPYGIDEGVLQELSHSKYLSIYPDPAQKAIRNEIAKYVGCSADNIVAGAGADELIDLICRLALNPGDKVLTFSPTFSYYKHVVELNGGILIDQPRAEDYSINTASLSTIDLRGIKIVLLCSPNNPSGNMLEEEVLDFFLKQNMLVVVDEAYYEFSRSSVAHRIDNCNNLIVLRTFSKCFGLAGLRVGYGIMSPLLHGALMKIKPPYSVNMAAELALRVCLQKKDIFTRQIDRMIDTRNRIIATLNACDEVQVYPSQSNFILFRIKNKNAKKLNEAMEKKGILLRYFNTPQLQNHLRVSVGTEEQIDVFFREFFSLMENRGISGPA